MDQRVRRGLLIAALLAGPALSGCSTMARGRVAQANLCESLRVSIYFEQDSAEITGEAKQVLGEAARMRRGCALGVVDILGLADAVGDPNANLKLSEQRAKAVTRTLGGLGFGNVNIAAAGESGATTLDGDRRPLRRRADVVFRSGGK
ncbi:MAG TPA: OmpA family protein [Caulobacter sp.]|nr:OmpA family protein [Caulobacter sp.]